MLYAGIDQVTRSRSYLRETIKGSDDATWRKAEKILTQFRAKGIKQRSTGSTVKFGYAIDECYAKGIVAS
ncbi:hypothetical protein [Amycolatopsis thermalba]|uniref:hypothetical protein n=1 Tax=Amycolatopsis thermalba TaxID=944492 RepID=UPI0013BE98AD|nr:hypothetical protein [Amycolatopsis thermalba]